MNKKIVCVCMVITLISLSICGCKGKNELKPTDHSNALVEDKQENIVPEISKDEKDQTIDNQEYTEKENNQNNKISETENTEKENNEKDNEDKLEDENQEHEEEEQEEQDHTEEPSMDNTKTAWWFIRNKDHKTPKINENLKYNLKDYDAYYVGNTEQKVLYLTFDEGYENGYTPQILDILNKNEVKATFFVTLPYVKERPDLVKRMENEGHVVGNHSKSHLSMPDVTNHSDKFQNELKSVEEKYKEVTGKDMIKYFRPPMGEYSQKSLAMTKELGYKSIFWSFAYKDWEPTEQPDPAEAKESILQGLHNGAILLLHAVSKTNTEILEDIIIEAKNQGYEFELLP